MNNDDNNNINKHNNNNASKANPSQPSNKENSSLVNKDPPTKTAATAAAVNTEIISHSNDIQQDHGANKTEEKAYSGSKKPGAVSVKEEDTTKFKKDKKNARLKYSTLFEGAGDGAVTSPAKYKYPNEEPSMNRQMYLEKIKKEYSTDAANAISPGVVALKDTEDSKVKNKKERRSQSYIQDAAVIARIPNEEPRSSYMSNLNNAINKDKVTDKTKAIAPGVVAENHREFSKLMKDNKGRRVKYSTLFSHDDQLPSPLQDEANVEIYNNLVTDTSNTTTNHAASADEEDACLVNAVLSNEQNNNGNQNRGNRYEGNHNYEMPIATSAYDSEVALVSPRMEPDQIENDLIIVDAKVISLTLIY